MLMTVDHLAELRREVEAKPTIKFQRKRTASQRNRFRSTPWNELRPSSTGAYAVKGLVPSPSLTLVIGQSGSGKTFLTGHLAVSVAAGRPVFGKRVRQGAVVYVASENPASVKARFAAWREHMGIQDCPLIVIDGSVDLLSAAAMDDLLEAIDAAKTEHGHISMVVIDTAAAAAPGADENTSKDMSAIIGACQAVRDEHQCGVVLVHHLGKDSSRGARGHSSLHAAADSVIEIEGDSEIRVARIKKARDAANGEELSFRLTIIDLGVDEDGDPISTCFVEPASHGTPARTKKAKLTHQNKAALDCLRELIERSADRTVASSTVPAGKPYVTKAAWLERFRARHGEKLDGMDPKGRDKELERTSVAIKRACIALSADQVIGTWGDSVWIW